MAVVKINEIQAQGKLGNGAGWFMKVCLVNAEGHQWTEDRAIGATNDQCVLKQ